MRYNPRICTVAVQIIINGVIVILYMFFFKHSSTLLIVVEVVSAIMVTLGLLIINIYFSYILTLHFKTAKVGDDVPKPT